MHLKNLKYIFWFFETIFLSALFPFTPRKAPSVISVKMPGELQIKGMGFFLMLFPI